LLQMRNLLRLENVIVITTVIESSDKVVVTSRYFRFV